MSTTLDPREVEATSSPDSDTPHPAAPDEPPARPHEPGARAAPLSRMLHP